MLRPIRDRILIKPKPEATVSAGGIHIPGNVDPDGPVLGEVVAVGPGRRDDSGFLIPIDVTPGSTVLFARYGGQPYDYQGVEYRLVVENEILGVVG